jgi:isopentenyl-diphosphate Delta-isomerase
MNEITIVNIKDEILKYGEKFASHRHPVPLHRAISVVIYSPDKTKMLLQQRQHDKFTWPLLWSNTTCTNVPEGETYEQCAHRRLKEEMGFDTKLTDTFNFIYEAKYNEEYGEHELNHTFIGVYDGEVNMDPKEGEAYKWMDIQELLEDLKNNPDTYTPWFKIILDKLKLV